MKPVKQIFIYRKRLVRPYVERGLSLLNGFSTLVALLLVVTVVFNYGFVVSAEDLLLIHNMYTFAWVVFLTNSLLRISLDYERVKQQYGLLAWVVNIMLYITLLPLLFPVPITKMMQVLYPVLNHPLYNIIVLTILSILQISSSLVRLLSQRINPSFIFSISFLVIILIGAGLLMLPRATYGRLSFIDALFVSTSATCVTGLSTVDVATQFTPMGLLFILILIQIGGVGVMTLTSFFALFFMGNTSLCNQAMISNMVSSKSLGTLVGTLVSILGFTLAIEAIGALLIWCNIQGTLGMTLEQEIAFSIFHAISAFCNAGFSTLPNNLGNELLLGSHNSFYLIISFLVILGGIGFPILVNLFHMVKYYSQRLRKQFQLNTFKVERRVHISDINTKIAFIMTLVLLLLGTVIIAVQEWNNSFADMSVWSKCVQAFFNAASPRTAGFNSVSISALSTPTILLFMLLMVIGGGTQSTAGGIKVNAFAVILLNLKAILQGKETVTVFNRELSYDSIRRSNSTLVLYLLFVLISLYLLVLFEPEAPLLGLLFEAISALSTVGASLDITPTLGMDSKLVIIALMFIGRVGVLTIMTSLIKQHKINKIKYPSGDIIIN